MNYDGVGSRNNLCDKSGARVIFKRCESRLQSVSWKLHATPLPNGCENPIGLRSWDTKLINFNEVAKQVYLERIVSQQLKELRQDL